MPTLFDPRRFHRLWLLERQRPGLKKGQLRNAKMFQSNCIFRVLDGYAQPNMRWRFAVAISIAKISSHQRTALRQYLVSVPVGGFHRVEYGINEGSRNVLVKEVAHGVDEYTPRLSPT
jgi:hypothetical protein